MQKTWTEKQFVRLLRANGYTHKRTTGGHLIYTNADGRIISFTNNKLNRMVARRLIKENHLKEVG